MSGSGVHIRPRAERGATVVEFAIVAPLLFLLIFGVIEFGRAIATYTSVYTVAREGARFATTLGDRNSDGLPNFVDCEEIRSAARARAVLVTLEDEDINITYDSGPGSPQLADCQGGTEPSSDEIVSGSRITVTANAEFRSPIPIISNVIGTLEPTSRQSRSIFQR